MEITSPKITVAVPSYNKEKYIERCLLSILNESSLISKIILVDNNSTDKTYEIAKKFEPKISCFKNGTNLGMAGNWNRCIELCETDWLMIFHADDEMVPGGIKKYLDFIAANPSVGLIHADSYSTTDGVNRTLTQKHQKSFWKAGIDALKCEYGVCSAVLVKKEAYERLGNFINESLSADAEMWARVAGKYDVGYINEPTVVYHVNPSSTGPISLVIRPVKDIIADWDNLNQKIAQHYPDEVSRKKFINDRTKDFPYSIWAITKANLRAGNYFKAMESVYLIIFKYGGFFDLIKIFASIIKKKTLA